MEANVRIKSTSTQKKKIRPDGTVGISDTHLIFAFQKKDFFFYSF